jgi:hypothetical protein
MEVIKTTFCFISISLICILFLLIILIKYQEHNTNLIFSKINKAAEIAQSARKVDFNKIKNLPHPVRKYFMNVLKEGQYHIKAARFTQAGELTLSSNDSYWHHFTANQYVSTLKPGFLWNSKISVTPFLHVRVLDSYFQGKGYSAVLLMSAIMIDSSKDDSKMHSSALFRYLAESPWYPTALLPENGVKWTPIDNNRAKATITDSGITISLEFTFNDSGEIEKIYTTERYGLFEGNYLKYPWEGRFSNYIEMGGMRIPSDGEVGWHLSEGFWLFWKGKIISIDYTY